MEKQDILELLNRMSETMYMYKNDYCEVQLKGVKLVIKRDSKIHQVMKDSNLRKDKQEVSHIKEALRKKRGV